MEPPAAPGQEAPKPPIYHDAASSQPSGAAAESPVQAGVKAFQTEEATLSADLNTNTIIVVAPPAVQQMYEHLIKMLDKRRPQVLIEVTLITLDKNDGLSFGVEILNYSQCHDNRILNFSSFGLSNVSTGDGSLSLTPGMGFNGTLIAPDVADVVIKALATSGKARVQSAPKILVNDNATGSLSSISEAPFTSVNASNTVATTSFAGYASAGTTINVTPHISEGDHLQLQYSVTLNSFTGEGSNGVPPPRQTNNLTSKITIPDGYSVIVGGLKRLDNSHTVSKVPLLGDIPWLGYAFSNNVWNNSESTLFVFIRPIVLRDDTFEDLKYLSEQDLAKAGMQGNLPVSQPLEMQ